MKYLAILKRFEIWLLLAVVAAIFFYAGQSPDSEADAPEDSPDDPVVVSGDESDSGGDETGDRSESEGLRVENIDLRPSQGGSVLEVTLLGRSRTGEPATVDESSLMVRTAEGEPVPHFFEPFRRTAVLSGKEESMATVRLWLESPTEAIRLEFQGEEIKAELPES